MKLAPGHRAETGDLERIARLRHEDHLEVLRKLTEKAAH